MVSPIGGLFENWESIWLPIVAFSCMVLILLYGLIYSLARAFNIKEIEPVAKSEMLQALATFFIAILILGVMVATAELIAGMGLTGECKGTTFSSASGSTDYLANLEGPLDFVSCRFQEKAESLAKAHASIYKSAKHPFKEFSAFVYFMGIPFFCYGGVCATGGSESLYKTVESYRFLYGFIPKIIIALNSYIILINYIKANMLSFFMPAGILLRGFPPTRGIGAVVMSIAISLYIIFPVVFMMTDPGVYQTPVMPIPNPPKTDSYNLCLPTFTGSILSFYYSETGSASASGYGSAQTYMSSIEDMIGALTNIYFGVILHPFVAFAIAMLFARYLSQLLGGYPHELIKISGRFI
ncbi:MAG: hypothetical protein QW035_04235 [Candidatus Anstonellales archaeon]